MNDTWAFGLSFSASHLFFELGITWVWAFFYLTWPMSLLSCVYGLTGVPTMPLQYSCYDITYLFASLLPLGLRAEAPTMSIFYIIPSFGLYYPAFLLANPLCTLGFLSPFHSLGVIDPFHHSLPLSLPWAFAKSFALPWSNYYILTFGFNGL